MKELQVQQGQPKGEQLEVEPQQLEIKHQAKVK